LVNIDIGLTEKEVIKELINLYNDSSLLNSDINKYFGNLITGQEESIDYRKINRQIENNSRKSLCYKVCQTIDQYVQDECISPENIEKVFITGGALKLKSHESKKNLKAILQK